jgi:hypothetical protein
LIDVVSIESRDVAGGLVVTDVVDVAQRRGPWLPRPQDRMRTSYAARPCALGIADLRQFTLA